MLIHIVKIHRFLSVFDFAPSWTSYLFVTQTCVRCVFTLFFVSLKFCKYFQVSVSIFSCCQEQRVKAFHRKYDVNRNMISKLDIIMVKSVYVQWVLY